MSLLKIRRKKETVAPSIVPDFFPAEWTKPHSGGGWWLEIMCKNGNHVKADTPVPKTEALEVHRNWITLSPKDTLIVHFIGMTWKETVENILYVKVWPA